ncbi:hypothetical protein WSM22_19560 [Cytophagales bacterium WSM2-2]|nr:hypothetical protein WSM22_19560 [Cytophagales bacterium WSM2-2]
MKLNGFDKIAAIYDRLAKLVFGRSIIHSQTYFLNRIPDDAKVLILGGGSGQLLTELFKIKPGIEVCYIEASSKMISLSGRRVEEGQRIKFIHGTEDNIPEGTRFDVIVTAFFLDLFSNESLRGVLMKITKSHATPCLWIVADFVNQKRWHASMLRVMYFFFRITSGVELKRLPEWERLIIESGGRELKSELFYNRFIKAALFQF